jgi:hypothetical protein
MSASNEAEEPGRYLLGSRERRGLLAGWRPGQVASVATGLVLAVGLLRVVSGSAGLALALVVTLAGIAGACWPVAGRALDEWIPAVLRHALLGIGRGRRWRDPAPGDGRVAFGAPRGGLHRAGRAAAAAAATKSPRPAGRPGGCFGPIELESFGGGGGSPIGAVRDRERGTWTAVVSVVGGGFALLGPEERRERVAAWARLLAAIARDGTVVHRLQWIERCIPDDGAALRAHFERAGCAGADDGAAAARSSYGRLLDLTAQGAVCHEHYLAVTVREPRTAGLGPRRRSPTASLEQLAHEAGALERALRQAGVGVRGILDPEALAATLAAAFDSEPSALVARPPWPEAYDVEWDHFRAGATVHASYWVAEWPRTEVSDDFLVPLLTSAAVRRTFSVTLAPVPPLTATRHAEHARTTGVADAEVRRRHGFAVTARARQDHESVLRREAELAAGHASYRFSGYLTVTERDPVALAHACEAVERVAAGCQLDLRRLYGAQDAGFLATLPIGRGLS